VNPVWDARNFFDFRCQKTLSPKALKVGVFHPTTHDPVLGDDASADSTGRQTTKGLASIAAMIRHAGDQKLTGDDGVEQRIAATLDRIQTDLSGMQRVERPKTGNCNPGRAPSIARTCSPPHFHRTLSR
jgi:hypothetical protein